MAKGLGQDMVGQETETETETERERERERERVRERERDKKTHRGGRAGPPTSVGGRPNPLYVICSYLIFLCFKLTFKGLC